MALSVTKEGPLDQPDSPIIYGKPLNWQAVRKEHSNSDMLPSEWKHSIFRAQEHGLYLRIDAHATHDAVSLNPFPQRYIGFFANLVKSNNGLLLMTYDVRLKYPPRAGMLLKGKR